MIQDKLLSLAHQQKVVSTMWNSIIMTASIALTLAAPKVNVQTSLGSFIVELHPEQAPKTVENFINYVESGFYSKTVFHRVIKNFVIQGGGFDTDLHQKSTQAPIPLESKNGLKNDKYTLAMARTSVPDSATSQFYINVNNNNMLDYPNPDGYGYAVFGSVIDGKEVVDQIADVATGNVQGMSDVPTQPVLIESITVINE